MRIPIIAFALLLSFLRPGWAAEPPKTPVELVALLGDPSFKVREAASRELLAQREKSLDALRTGAGSPDPEIAQRCVRLLPTIRDAVAESLLKRFAENPATLNPDDLPGLLGWVTVAGKTPDSLAAYREILRGERAPLEELQRDPTRLEPLYRQRLLAGAAPESPMTAAEFRMFLFLGSQRPAHGKLMPKWEAPISWYVVDGLKKAGFLDGPRHAPTATLFAAWLERENHPMTIHAGLVLISGRKIREATPSLVRMAANPVLPVELRGLAMETLAEAGSIADADSVAGLLKDATVMNAGVSQARGELQMRDIALGVLVLWSGRDPEAFGFEDLAPEIGSTRYTEYTIRDGQRETALKLWFKSQTPPPKAK